MKIVACVQRVIIRAHARRGSLGCDLWHYLTSNITSLWRALPGDHAGGPGALSHGELLERCKQRSFPQWGRFQERSVTLMLRCALCHTLLKLYMETPRYMHTHMHACMRTCIHACIHTHMHARMHAYIHTDTCIHIYMHACIHTHRRMHSYTDACSPILRHVITFSSRRSI